MTDYQRQRWERLFDQARHDLREEQCGSVEGTKNLSDLISNLNRMATIYGKQDLPQLTSKMQPVLSHVESFAAAITSASQYDRCGCLVWGGIQAVLKVCCFEKKQKQ